MDTFTGVFDWFGDSDNWQGQTGIPARLLEHLLLSTVALVICCVIALPIALWLGHIGRGGTLAIQISNVGRAVPTFAVLVLLVLSPLGISFTSTVIALVLFGIPPILTNAYVGIREVDQDMVESARGMGMTGWQILRGVEVPSAMGLIMNGVRIAALQIVATATIAAIVGGGGLGRIITAGFAFQNLSQVVAGAILVAALALLTEGFFAFLQRRLDPVSYAANRARTTPTDINDPVAPGGGAMVG